MTIERTITWPLQTLQAWGAIAQERLMEWVRREIIDDDPYEIEVCWDGEFLVTQSGSISDISSLADVDLEAFIEYIIVERELCSDAATPSALRSLDVKDRVALSQALKQELASAKHAVCAQVSTCPVL